MLLPPLYSQMANNSDAVAAVAKLEEETVKTALAHTDAAFMKANYADDFVEGTSFGDWRTKSDDGKGAFFVFAALTRRRELPHYSLLFSLPRFAAAASATLK